MRLSFITAEDQAKFEQLFKAAAGDDVTLEGRCRPAFVAVFEYFETDRF